MNGCKGYCVSNLSDEELKEIIDKEIRGERLLTGQLDVLKIYNKPNCLNLKK